MPKTKKKSADKRRKLKKELRKNNAAEKESNLSLNADTENCLGTNTHITNVDKTNLSHVSDENSSNTALETKERKRLWIQGKRKDANFRQQELEKNKKHIKVLRSDEHHKIKEREMNKNHMKTLRSDEQYKIQEREVNKNHMNTLRSDERYKIQEREVNKNHMNILRSDEQYKVQERVVNKNHMIALRSNDDYKMKEYDINKEHKKSLRKDGDYKNKELEINKNRMKVLRSDDAHRTKELETNREYKKKMLLNKEFQHKVHETDKNRKRKVRENPDYREVEKEKDRTAKKRKIELHNQITNALSNLCNVNPQRRTFINLIKEGPTQACSCCYRLWFPRKCSEIGRESIITKFGRQFWENLFIQDMNTRVICNSCKSDIFNGKVPKLCAKNYRIAFPIPQELKDLTKLEERLVSPRIPFMSIRCLGYDRQCSIKGQIVNVPINIDTTVNVLPRNINDTHTCQLKLKRRQSYNNAYLCETVRPALIRKAAKYLVEQPLYKAQGIKLSETWMSNDHLVPENEGNLTCIISDVSGSENRLAEDCSSLPTRSETRNIEESLSHNHDEPVDKLVPCNVNAVDENGDVLQEFEDLITANVENELNQLANLIEEFENEDFFNELNPGGQETLLDNDHLENIALAPGEGQKPIHLLYDQYAEELSFPTIFCGNAKEFKVKMSYSDIARLQAAYCDRRFARTDFLLYMYKKLQLFQVITQVNVALRKTCGEQNKYTAKEIKCREFLDRLIKHDAGYMFLQRLTSSPAHWQREKNKLMSMIRQFNIPTLFVTITAAETMWPELLVVLAKVVQNKNISEEEALNMAHEDKCFLIRSDPVTCSRYFDNRFHLLLSYMKSTDGPFKDNPIIHYYYRVEMQQRGSPHVHLLLWLEKAPIFDASNEESIKQCEMLIKKYITCDSSLDSVKNIIHYQVHRHAKNCKREVKGVVTCRYGMPFLPFDETTILSPSAPSDAKLTKNQQKESKEIFKKIKDFLSNSKELQIPFSDFLSGMNLTREQYVANIKQNITKPTVFLKREVKDCFVNAFSEDIFTLQRSNMDIQFILDPYACCSYIINYINKADRGVSRMLLEAMAEIRNGNQDLKQQLKTLGNVFINASEVSAQEAAYTLLRLHMSETSTGEIFINTKPFTERVRILKPKAELNLLEDEDTDIYQSGIIEHYTVRPDSLEDLCLAEFAGFYTFSRYDESKHAGKNVLTLKDKSGILIKRRSTKIVSYHRYGIQQDPISFYRQQLMLFMPWRNEERDLINIDQEQIYVALIDQIKLNRKKFDILDSSVLDEAYSLAERHAQEIFEDSNDDHELDPEYQVYGVENPEVSAFPDEENAQAAEKQTFPTPFQIDNAAYEEIISSLNAKQYEYLMHILKKIKRDQIVYEILSGGAGVGKSRLVEAIYQSLLRHYNSRPGNDPTTIKILLTAPTGKAAFNIGGITLHSSFSLPVTQHNEQMLPLSHDTVNSIYTKLADLKLVIIDEFSMMGSNMFHHLNARLQQIFKSKKDFAGKSILLVGDLRQLPPVGDRWIFLPTYKNPYSDICGRHLWEKFKYFELSEIMRQRDDKKFAISLNNMADGVMTKDDIELFTSRKMSSDETLPENTIHLFRSNREVDAFNETKLKEYSTQRVTSKANDVIKGSCSEKMKQLLLKFALGLKKQDSFGLMTVLTLQINAKYMISINLNVQDGIVNGATGILRKIDFSQDNTPHRVWIEFPEEKVGRQTRAKHHSFMMANNIPTIWTPLEKTARALTIKKNSSATVERRQFPLLIAEAITIHKSQGSTYTNVAVHVDKYIQRSALYVACSRATCLAGLYVYGEFHAPKKPSVYDKNYAELQTLRNQKTLKTEFHKQFSTNGRKIIVAYQNIQSFKKNLKFVKNNPVFMSSDLIIFVETWVNECDNISLENYSCFINMCNKDKHKPFGILCYKRQNLEIEFIKETIISDGSYSFQGVTFKYKDAFIIAAYVPPKFKTNEAANILKGLINQTNGNCLIIGDFNLDLMHNKSNAIKELLESFGFSSSIDTNMPTTKAPTHIDWCFANFLEVKGITYETVYSHHKAIAVSVYEDMSDALSQISDDINWNDVDKVQDDLEVRILSDNDEIVKDNLLNHTVIDETSESENMCSQQTLSDDNETEAEPSVSHSTLDNIMHSPLESDHYVSHISISSPEIAIHGPLQNSMGENACYANSSVQVFLELEEFRNSIQRHESDIDIELKRILLKESDSTYCLRTLVHRQFETREQQDVMEFIECFLNKLHDDFLETLKVSIADDVKHCTFCNFEDNGTISEWYWYRKSVPKTRNLRMQFSELFDYQNSGLVCGMCGNESLQTKTILHNCNKYLLLNLVRTDFENHEMVKINTTFTDFHWNDISIDGLTFSVKAVIIHDGATITSGHYYCIVRQENGRWLKCNDTTITDISRFDNSLKDVCIMILEKT